MAGGNPNQPVPNQAPRTRTIDMRTMAKKYNQGQQKNPSYEWPNARKHYQPRDQENE